METMKRWALCLLVLSAAVMLWGCSPASAQNGRGFYVRITNETGERLDSVHQEYSVGGRACGGGAMCHADGSPILPGEQFSWEFLPEDFPEDADLTLVEIQFFLSAGDGAEQPTADRITVPVTWGNTCDVRLTGNSGDGYRAQLSKESVRPAR